MKQYNMVLTDVGVSQLVGQSDDPQWYIGIYHTAAKQINANTWQLPAPGGIIQALEVNGTFQFSQPFILSEEDIADVFDVPTTESNAAQ